jgi:predicted TIM-barrel fold metal-dependent hydrolase
MKNYTLLITAFCLTISLGVCTAQSKPDELLLKNYNPQSIYKIPVTTSRKVKTPIIDMHSHPYPESAKELEAWVKTLKELNIEKTLILSYSTGAKFDSVYQVFSKYGDLFEIWCGFDYAGYGTSAWPQSGLKELERCFKKGAKGVGELGDKGYGEMYSLPTKIRGIHIDDPKMRPLLKRCGQLKMPISIHVSEPEWMYHKMDSTNDGLMNAYTWRIDSSASGFKGHDALVTTLDNAVRENPGTTFIACHFANCETDLSQIGALLKKYPNLYADIAARFGETAPIPRYMKKFYQDHASKLVYGTDMGMDASMYKATFRILESSDEHFYEKDLSSYHWPFHGFDLDEKTLNQVYYQNALKILKR